MKLRDLIAWNPWWKGGREGGMYLEKYFAHAFLSERKLPDFEDNYLIRGPRQVGKTEFLFRIVAELMEKNTPPGNIVYLSCDRLGGIGELRNTVRELREVMKAQPGKKYLLLDEVTSIREWHKAVKEFCEDRFFTVYATGSRPKELESKAEYFPGRASIINFHPLSFREFCNSLFFSMFAREKRLPGHTINRESARRELLSFISPSLDVRRAKTILRDLGGIEGGLSEISRVSKLYKHFDVLDALFKLYLKVGGYPCAMEKMIQKEELPFEIVVKDTLGTIEKEGLSLDTLNRLLPELLKSIGSKIEYAGLAREVEVDTATVMRYIHTLERSFLLREVYYFDGKAHPKKGKKVYFSDPFIINALQNYYGLRDLEESRVIENVIVESIARSIEDPFKRLWKTRMGFGMLKGREVDIVVSESKLFRIEVKYGRVYKRKGIDIILTKDDLEVSERPLKIPVALFLLGLR